MVRWPCAPSSRASRGLRAGHWKRAIKSKMKSRAESSPPKTPKKVRAPFEKSAPRSSSESEPERSRMKYEAILYEKHGAVAKVITNRPRYKNAQSRVMIEEMDHAFAAANADDGIRVIILAAAGDTFSSGHDIGTPEEKADMRRRPFPRGR